MTKWMVAALVMCACKGEAKQDLSAKWLGAKLVPTDRDFKGVKLHVEVPEGLPENKESLVGPDWRVPDLGAGPRISLSVKERAFNHPDELAREVEPDPARIDLIEVSKGPRDGGGLQYVSSTNGTRHIDVTEWIPLADGRGVLASCHWYAGSDAKDSKTPDAKIVAWLTKVCATVRAQ